jgi:membrane-associated phospholipid phosphatase
MDETVVKEPPLPPQKHRGFLGAAYRRRPILLVALVAGLAGVLMWMPPRARVDLWLAIQSQHLLLALLFIFMLIALSLVWSAGQNLDRSLFLLLNLGGWHPGWVDNVMWVVTQIGSMGAALSAAAAFYYVAHHRLAIEIILGTLTLWLFVETVKALTDRARPFLVLEGTRIVGRRESGRSFPSGHTSQIFFMATIISRNLQLGLGPTIGLYALALLVGFTRVYVGAHYPRDVIGGALLGTVWGLLTLPLDPWLFAFGH